DWLFAHVPLRKSEAENDEGTFDKKYRYHYTIKGLEICKFADLFLIREAYNSSFKKFYDDCHKPDFYENAEFNLYTRNIRHFNI
ncbi:3027_t:CDS:2, partial [Cetraspora pellucida]